MERLDHRVSFFLLTFLLSSENKSAGNISNHIAQIHGASPALRHLIQLLSQQNPAQTMAKLLSTQRMDGERTLEAIHLSRFCA